MIVGYGRILRSGRVERVLRLLYRRIGGQRIAASSMMNSIASSVTAMITASSESSLILASTSAP